MSDIINNMRLKARDNARTPVQVRVLFMRLSRLASDLVRSVGKWDTTVNAGFTSGKPWMRVHDDYEVSRCSFCPPCTHTF
jgi:oligo-1,6-glucosidase